MQLGRNSRYCQVTKSWECFKILRANNLEKMIITQLLLAGDKVVEGQQRSEVNSRHCPLQHRSKLWGRKGGIWGALEMEPTSLTWSCEGRLK